MRATMCRMSERDVRDLVKRVNGATNERAAREARRSSEERVRELAERSKPKPETHVPDNMISDR